MKYDPQKHHRRSIRLKGYDYAQPGADFVTFCTFQRNEIFGEVIHGAMKLSALGKIANEEWLRSAEIRKEIRLIEDEFVVMPNHGHGIVWIVDIAVGADGVRPDMERIPAMRGNIQKPDARRASLRKASRSLGSFIAGFKASVTSRARKELNMTGIWQRNYYDHIIRSDREWTISDGIFSIIHSIGNWIVTMPETSEIYHLLKT